MALLVALAGGGVLLRGTGLLSERASAASCTGSRLVRIAAAPDVVPALESLTSLLEQRHTDVHGACLHFEVHPVAPDVVVDALAGGTENAPDLWVPDSPLWVQRARGTGVPVRVAVPSLASTPVVVVGGSSGRDTELSWMQLMSGASLSMTDPLTSSAGAAALLALHGEADTTGADEDTVNAVVVPLAQAYGAWQDRPGTPSEAVAVAGADRPAVLTEQQVWQLQRQGASGAAPRVPGTGAPFLDFPVVALADSGPADAGALALGALAGSNDGIELLAKAGLRPADHRPLPGGAGVGSVPALTLPGEAVASLVLQQWAALTRPTRSLAVFDVSGSMDYPAGGGRTRMELAVDAASTALRLFPDTAQLGVWAFSQDLAGHGRDHLALLPVRRLDARTDAGNQRDALAAGLHRLPRLTGGGTGLYDTTLAAVRHVQKGYDPGAVNTVVLLTDGTNDDPGSISLKRLLDTLRREHDAHRPVGVVAIGMGRDTDLHALRAIAKATGGASFVARDPGAIMQVFRDALLSRS